MSGKRKGGMRKYSVYYVIYALGIHLLKAMNTLHKVSIFQDCSSKELSS